MSDVGEELDDVHLEFRRRVNGFVIAAGDGHVGAEEGHTNLRLLDGGRQSITTAAAVLRATNTKESEANPLRGVRIPTLRFGRRRLELGGGDLVPIVVIVIGTARLGFVARSR